MHKAITAISSMLFGTSALIFILALVIPLLRGSPLLVQKGESDVYELSGSPKKLLEGLERQYSQNSSVKNESQLSNKQLQIETPQKQSNGLTASYQSVKSSGFSIPIAPDEATINPGRGDSGVRQPLQTYAETAISQINQQSTGQENPIGAMKNDSSPNNLMSLLVLGEGLFPPGEVTPKANVQKVIDKVIPLINAQPSNKVIVEGHVDNWLPSGVSPIQALKWNKIISYLRANEVAKVLKQKGVASDRILVKGLGHAVPIASNRTKEGRAKNRRVEIKLSPTY